jgi:hypothetical protein
MSEQAPVFGQKRWSRRRIRAGLGCFLLLWAAVLAGSPTVSHAAVEIPTPSWMEKTGVANKMIINGLTSTVQHFHADRKLKELLEFYRQRWDESYAGRSGYREAAVAPWHVISRLQGHYLLTVQAKATDALTCEGYLAVGDLGDVRKKKDSDPSVPKMEGSKVINDTVSFDPGKKGRTVMIVNDFSVSRNGVFYRHYYLDRGWGRLRDQANDGAQVLGFRRFGQQVQIVVTRYGSKTVTVLNLMETD